MRFVRYEADGQTSYGSLDDGAITPIEGDIFGDYQLAGTSVPLDSVRLLAPVVPGQMLAVALNYPSHLGEQPASPRPELFVKANNSLANPGDDIVLPAGSERVDYEGELVVVIGRRCKKVAVADALSYVFGYTCGNDVSARDWQRSDVQWFRGKSCDTFGPLGPWIVDGLDPTNLTLCTRLNGEEVQRCNTGEMINSVADCISFASQVLTLEPGDVIFTGTSGRPRALSAGDVVEVEVDGIGILTNPVVADQVASTWADRPTPPPTA